MKEKMKKLLLKLAQKYLMNKGSKFEVGDAVVHRDFGTKYEVIGIMYNYELKPFFILRDENSEIIARPTYEVKGKNEN